MFENIELFSKRNNEIEFPNENWTEKTKIHCTCELNLGFGEKVVWSHGNSIKLTKLIDFYNKLYYFEIHRSESPFIYEFPYNDFIYILEGIRDENDITYIFKRKYYKQKNILIEKKYMPLSTSRNSFFVETMKVLTSKTNNKVASKTGELFFKIYGSPHNYEFKIGQKVKTILTENIKTNRTGYIIDRFYHNKEQTRMYLILENNKLLTTRYRPNELEAIV